MPVASQEIERCLDNVQDRERYSVANRDNRQVGNLNGLDFSRGIHVVVHR